MINIGNIDPDLIERYMTGDVNPENAWATQLLIQLVQQMVVEMLEQ